MEHLHLKENIENLVKSGKACEVISKELKDQKTNILNAVVSLQDQCDVFVMIIRSMKSLLEKEKLDSIVKEEVLQVKVYVFSFFKW